MLSRALKIDDTGAQRSREKLAPLLKLKYGSINDATVKLGPPGEIRKVFIEFQQHLYERLKAA